MTCPSLGSTSELSLFYAIDPDPSAAIPDTTAWTGLRITGESLNLDIQSSISDEITQNRSYSDSVPTSGQSGGSIQFDLSYKNFDDFLVAVLQAPKDLHVSGTRASVSTGVAGSNNAIRYVANAFGTSAITVALVDPGAASQALSVVVTGTDIVVNLATSGASAITSTAAEVIAALNADKNAAALINATNHSTSNGTGVVAAVAATNLTGGALASNPWATTQSISNGTTKKCLAFLVRSVVGGTTYNFLFRGQQVDSLSLNFEPGGIVGGELAVQGLQGSLEASTKNWTFHPADGTKPLMAAADSLKGWSFTDDQDVAIPNTVFQRLGLTMSNSLRQQQSINSESLYAAGVASGRFMLEASSSIYFANGALYSQLVDNKVVKLAFSLTDSLGNVYAFDMDKMKVQGGAIPTAGGPDQDMMISPTLRAFEDATKGTVTITKTDA